VYEESLSPGVIVVALFSTSGISINRFPVYKSIEVNTKKINTGVNEVAATMKVVQPQQSLPSNRFNRIQWQTAIWRPFLQSEHTFS
jgi:hypothetical protein